MRKIEYEIREIVGEAYLNCGNEIRPWDEIDNTLSLEEDLDFDEIDIMEIAIEIETKYSIALPDGDIKKWKTVGDVVIFVKKLVEQVNSLDCSQEATHNQ